MSDKISIAIVGIGNVGKTLIKGLQFYQNSEDGLWHPKIAGFTVSDIMLTGIFDVDSAKVGKKIKQLIPDYNGTLSDVIVQSGILEDPVHNHIMQNKIKSVGYDEFVNLLKKLKPNFLINLISSGMDKSTERYADAALEAGCSFFNATSSKTAIVKRSAFESKKLLILGDDMMSQFGGTAFHRGMIEFMKTRGIKIQKAYQLDVGGNSDTQNTMSEEIREKKRKIKTESISIESDYPFKSTAGTTEYAEQLGNSRVSYYWMEAKGFLNSTVEMDLALKTNDSANGCNVILDSIRAAKMALLKNDIKKLEIISAYAFKNPPIKMKIRDSMKAFEDSFAN